MFEFSFVRMPAPERCQPWEQSKTQLHEHEGMIEKLERCNGLGVIPNGTPLAALLGREG